MQVCHENSQQDTPIGHQTGPKEAMPREVLRAEDPIKHSRKRISPVCKSIANTTTCAPCSKPVSNLQLRVVGQDAVYALKEAPHRTEQNRASSQWASGLEDEL